MMTAGTSCELGRIDVDIDIDVDVSMGATIRRCYGRKVRRKDSKVSQ